MNLPTPPQIVAALVVLLTPPAFAGVPGIDVPQAHVVSKGTVKVKANLDAIAEATQAEPIKLAPRTWMDLTVVEAVAHGSRVKKGDLLVKLDTEKLRDQIEDLEQDRAGSTLALDLAKHELENLRQTTPHKLEAARRASRIAEEEFQYFASKGRGAREQNSKFSVKSAEQRLENANEELTQLEKMYKADDLTEETEEIVIKRQRFVVETAQIGLQNIRDVVDRDLNVVLSREDESLRNARRDQQVALAYAELTLPKALSKKQQDVEKLKRDQRKAERRLADLRQDLEYLAPRAPIDGIVYYGACENGRWTTGPLVAKKLVSGGKLMPHEVVMTVVNPEKIRLRAVVAETELGSFATGMKGEATVQSAAGRKLSVKLDDLGIVPLPGGGFDAALSVYRDKNVRLLPGMGCKVTISDVEKNVALVVPKQAVFTEAGGRVVYVLKADGANEKRTVKTGESDDRVTEITEGLSEGDKVLLKKPEQT